MSQHHDPVVGDALRRLDVPDHGPDFWSRLDAGLAAAPGDRPTDGLEGSTPGEADEGDAEVLDLRAAAEARRRRPPIVSLAAAVAVVVALVVGAAVLAGGGADDESQIDTADPTVTSVPDVVPPPDTTVPETTTAPTSRPAQAGDIAQGWIDALAAGDADAAYALLDDASRARLTQQELFDLAGGLFEGAAAFAADGIDRSVTELDGFSVVTFSGEVEREGMVETASYPVVVTETGVHFVLDGPQLELDPATGGPTGSTLTSPLDLVIADGADVRIWFDGGEPDRFTGSGPVSIDVEQAAGPGTHLVSVVAAQDGLITSRTYTVVVP